MNALRVFERKIVRKICGPLKGGGRWGIKKTKEMKDVFQGAEIVKLIKSLRLRWCGRSERMENRRMPKQIRRATMEGAKKEEEHVKYGDASFKRV